MSDTSLQYQPVLYDWRKIFRRRFRFQFAFGFPPITSPPAVNFACIADTETLKTITETLQTTLNSFCFLLLYYMMVKINYISCSTFPPNLQTLNYLPHLYFKMANTENIKEAPQNPPEAKPLKTSNNNKNM